MNPRIAALLFAAAGVGAFAVYGFVECWIARRRFERGQRDD